MESKEYWMLKYDIELLRRIVAEILTVLKRVADIRLTGEEEDFLHLHYNLDAIAEKIREMENHARKS